MTRLSARYPRRSALRYESWFPDSASRPRSSPSPACRSDSHRPRSAPRGWQTRAGTLSAARAAPSARLPAETTAASAAARRAPLTASAQSRATAHQDYRCRLPPPRARLVAPAASALQVASSCLPGTPCTMTRAVGCRYCCTKRRTESGRHAPAPLDVLSQIIRRSDVVVVQIQLIRNPAKSATPLQAAERSRLDHIAHALDFCGRRTLLAQRCELFIDSGLELLQRASWSRGRIDAERRAQHGRGLVRVHALRNLPFVDQLLVQPARTPVTEHTSSDICVGITVFEECWSDATTCTRGEARRGPAQPHAVRS